MSMMPPDCTFGARSLRPWVRVGFVWRLGDVPGLRPRPETGRDESGFQNPGASFRPLPCRSGHALEGGGVGQDALDEALLAGVLAGQDQDGVALADLGHARLAKGHHSTSGASETIFM
jgi:hypothetical protein